MILRDKELKILNDDFVKPKSSLNFIFARKKLGKTTLINTYTKEKNTIYLPVFDTLESILINRNFASICNFFGIKQRVSGINKFEDLFLFIAKQNIESKIVIVLENLNILQKNDKEFLKKFFIIWNKYLKRKNIQFIITSALYSSKKDDKTIYEKADNIIRLRSLSHKAISLVIPKLEKKDLLYVYSVYGTNPHNLSFYNSEISFYENIKKDFFNPNNYLFNEGLNIIKSELSDIATYSSILYAIAKGNTKIGDIANFLKLKSSYLTRYLQNLVDLMIIEKEIPINENQKNSKFGRYFIEDNYLKFWFSYIYANMTPNKNDFIYVLNHIKFDLSNRLIHENYKKQSLEIIKEDIDKFFGFTPIKIGRWWNNKNKEIDIVAYDNKNITFVDCILKGKESLEDSYINIQEKAEYFETTLNKKFAIFTQ